MKSYLTYSKVFLLLSALTILTLGFFIGYCDKIEMHLWLNGCHTSAQDFIWSHYTIVGEWVPYVIVALLLFYKAGWASFLLMDVLLSGGIGQIIKHIVNADRPLTYFANHAPDIQLQLVEGVRMSEFYSFPSGHTTTFFALFMTLTIISCDWYSTYNNASTSNNSLLPVTCHLSPVTCYLLPITCYLLAVSGAYSRIYLSQHFAEDVLGGMCIGILTTIGLLFVVPKLDKTRFWNWNLQQLKKK